MEKLLDSNSGKQISKIDKTIIYGQTKLLISAAMELVRLAIPRRVYTQSHVDYVIETFEEILKEKDQAKGVKITYEPKFLRHFTAHFERLN